MSIAETSIKSSYLISGGLSFEPLPTTTYSPISLLITILALSGVTFLKSASGDDLNINSPSSDIINAPLAFSNLTRYSLSETLKLLNLYFEKSGAGFDVSIFSMRFWKPLPSQIISVDKTSIFCFSIFSSRFSKSSISF